MYKYPIEIHHEANSVWATCRDLPEFHAAADTLSELMSESADGIVSALSIYVDQRRAIPKASSPLKNEHVVHLSALILAKIELWNTMIERDMRKADLVRTLNAKPVTVDRLIDFCHSSKLEHVENALLALGKRLSISVEPA
ncbi:type II toxin-antitoxin system HicB family antitoxin [Kushneria phosphatilytica]|uniref:Type II toxin-antitoxin system HicB family antitoxin n=1 Tax=Kushneria phosphatilytica TaxID=657387 RepID=A0A5C0ZXG7_9GAMM|nr:type II toxin-antitoxin system HicB family antitoxin [Kushneria phosphatilytica]QEL10861.1 type II toxin-antitoxin system HicB family antitoxin [Kushneria phosphatilytica]